MARCRIAWALPLLASVLAWTTVASAQTPAPAFDRLTQAAPPPAPAPPVPRVAPAPAAPAPAAPQTADSSVGSVATLQGGASVTRDKADRALKVKDTILRGDVLQTASDGTLGITFDDETTFTLTPNSRIAVDDFVYQQGAAKNAAVFNILQGTVAFVAQAVAKTGDMKIETPTATMGIRGTSGLVEIPAGAAPGATGEVAIKLYPDENGRVGRIEVFGRDGARLGVLTRGSSGFSIRPGAAGGRFSAVPLRISPQQAARDRGFVRGAFAAQRVGRGFNIERRPNLQGPQRGPGRTPGGPGRTPGRPGLQRQPGQQGGGQRPALRGRPGLQRQPGQQGGGQRPALGGRPGLQRVPGQQGGAQRPALGGRPGLQRLPGQQGGAQRPALRGRPGLQGPRGLTRTPPKKPPPKKPPPKKKPPAR